MIRTLDRAIREVWGYHFRIPETAYWLTIPVAVLLLLVHLPGELAVVPTIALALCIVGVVRWRLVKRRCRFAVVVPLFQESSTAKGRGAEAQTLIVDHLRRHVSEPMRSLVQPLAVDLGPTDEALAGRLRRKLRAIYVLHGRVTAHGDSWSIFPRVLEGPTETVTHYDRFTRDITPGRPSFGPFVASLSPSIGVRDEEFPLDFCHDLEAVIEGLAGLAFGAVKDFQRALSAFDSALSRAEDSTNAQIDSLRAGRALALEKLGRADEGISFLRDRLHLPDPSPHLLRTLAHLLTTRAWSGTSPNEDADLNEARQHLRAALESKIDPDWETTAYNLVMLLGFGDPEALELIDRLTAKASGYRKLWYVRKLRADIAWQAYSEAWQSGEDHEAMEAYGKESAKWYSRTLRARPRMQIKALHWRWPFVTVKTFPRSPILYANAKDGHDAAGHRIRARYFEWRFNRIRNRMLKLGDRYLRNADWNMAYAHFDWSSCVGRRDGTEYRAAAFAACCCWKGGRKEDGLSKWNELAHENPNCLLGRALMALQLNELELDLELPGDEPTGIEEVMELIVNRFPGWVWHTDGEFITPSEFAELEGPDS